MVLFLTGLFILAINTQVLACAVQHKLLTLYDQAIMNASTHSLHPVELLTIPSRKIQSIHFVTWTRRSYSFGVQKLAENVWVTVDFQMRKACRAFAVHRLSLNIEQLLGMPPLKNYSGWHIVTMSLLTMQHASPRLFRPCLATHSIIESTCRYQDNPSAEGYLWGEQNLLQKPARLKSQYPWTGLGYTYNWNPQASSKVGLSEFVISKGTVVNVRVSQTAQAFCL